MNHEEERLAKHVHLRPESEEGKTKLHVVRGGNEDDDEEERRRMVERDDSKPALGTVGLVDEKERAKMDEAELSK